MNGDKLALGVVAALAAAGLVSRKGSRAPLEWKMVRLHQNWPGTMIAIAHHGDYRWGELLVFPGEGNLFYHPGGGAATYDSRRDPRPDELRIKIPLEEGKRLAAVHHLERRGIRSIVKPKGSSARETPPAGYLPGRPLKYEEYADTVEGRRGTVVFSPEGLAAMPTVRNVEYLGFMVWMRPSEFLALNPLRRDSPFHIQHLREGGSFGVPWLDLTVPSSAYDDDTVLYPQTMTLQVRGHEGRGRMMAVLEEVGDVPVPVGVTAARGWRSRHFRPVHLAGAILLPDLGYHPEVRNPDAHPFKVGRFALSGTEWRPTVVRYYHGTTQEGAEDILDRGFSHGIERRRDPGDFGWGTYLTQILGRAENMGEVVLELDVDTSSFAHFPHPYFRHINTLVAPQTDAQRLFFDIVVEPSTRYRRMRTVHGSHESRGKVAREVRDRFLAKGIGGITTGLEDGETVVFDLRAIKNIRRIR